MGLGPSLWGGCCGPGCVGGQLSWREWLSCSSRRHGAWVHLWSPVQAEMVIKPTQISARKSRLCHKDCYCLVTQLCLTLCDPMEYSPSGLVPLSMEFSRQEYWSGLPFPSPGDLPHPGIKPGSPALRGDSLPSEPPGKPYTEVIKVK